MDVFLIIAAIILVVLFLEKMTKVMIKYDVIPEAYPIIYPLEPMLDNYVDIYNAINECDSIAKLNAPFIRIIIFQGCYADAQVEYAELMQQYLQKEAELNTIRM